MASASFRHPLATLRNATPWGLAAANLCAGCPTQPRAEEALELLDIKLDTFASLIQSETRGQTARTDSPHGSYTGASSCVRCHKSEGTERKQKPQL